jgi:hypothetical protein
MVIVVDIILRIVLSSEHARELFRYLHYRLPDWESMAYHPAEKLGDAITPSTEQCERP